MQTFAQDKVGELAGWGWLRVGEGRGDVKGNGGFMGGDGDIDRNQGWKGVGDVNFLHFGQYNPNKYE